MLFIIFLVLIFLSAFFSSAEIAFFSLTKAQARNLIDRKERNAKLVWKLKHNPQHLLVTILIGNNVANVLTASLATVLAVRLLGSLGVGVATGVVTLLILVFGEITPKSLAQKNNQWIALHFAPVLYALTILFFPINWILIVFNNILAKKLFRIKMPKLVTEDEIRTLARLGVETGSIAYRERELIENVFRFNDICVGEVMTQRYKIVFLNGEVPVEQIAYFVAQSGFSRYPVYVGDEDRVVGYVHINDLMKILNSDQREMLVKDIVRPIRRIHESKKIESLFRTMIQKQEHMVLVTRNGDEKEIIGLVTLEDILEELVGEIVDETDMEEDEEKL